MALEIFDSGTNRRPSSVPMLNLTSGGILRFNVLATETIKQTNTEKLQLLWDSDTSMIGIKVAVSRETQAYTITYSKSKTVCQIVARPFPRRIGMTEKSLRVDLQIAEDRALGLSSHELMRPSPLIFVGTIPNKYMVCREKFTAATITPEFLDGLTLSDALLLKSPLLAFIRSSGDKLALAEQELCKMMACRVTELLMARVQELQKLKEEMKESAQRRTSAFLDLIEDLIKKEGMDGETVRDFRAKSATMDAPAFMAYIEQVLKSRAL